MVIIMLEKEIFKRSHFDNQKLISYGFKKINDYFIYEKNILNNSFKVIIKVDNDISSKVIDLKTNEEYINHRTKMAGDFVSKVRESLLEILNDIKDNCCINEYFIYNQSNSIVKYIKNKYDINPEFLWEDLPSCGVFRNKKTNKWFGIIMNIDRSKIMDSKGEVEVINIKLDPDVILDLINKDGYYKAYHMNKKYWITLILDNTLNDKEIYNLIDKSYKIVD